MNNSDRPISVIGAGTMGHGIAQVFAMNGYNVVLIDISEDILKRAMERIKWSLDKLASKGRISREKAEEALGRIRTTTSLKEGVRDSGFIIEAVPEDLSIKIRVFREVDENTPEDAIIASNTSGLPITAMAEATSRPGKVVGMHWFNPPQLMRLVEVVKGEHTDPKVVSYTVNLAIKLGKEPIVVNKDIRGFVANRIYRAVRYESFVMVLRGEYKPVEIDSSLKHKLGLPMGVFELVDFTGAIEIEIDEDKHLQELRRRYPEWEPHEDYVRIRSHALLLSRKYYEKGMLGVKTGRGFYEYPAPGKYARPNIPKEAGEKLDPVKVLAPAINLSAWMVEHNITTADEIDLALKLGYNFPRGLIELGREWGANRIIEVLEEKASACSECDYKGFYDPNPILKDLLG